MTDVFNPESPRSGRSVPTIVDLRDIYHPGLREMSNIMSSKGAQSKGITVKVEPVTAAEDFAKFFDVSALAFGRQVNDGIWTAMNPGWDTPKGREMAISRLISRWSSTTKDRNGNPNTIFLKATVPRQDEPGKEDIAGAAIWVQASMVEGYGDEPTTEMDQSRLDALLPENPEEQNYLRQLSFGLQRRRVEVVHEIASSSSPAVMVLDLCAVDPAFQRLGIATKLVEWGLSEAKRRGGLESILEASSMGRHVYKKLGFEQDGGEFQYQVDEQFQHRGRPSNVFMRTGRPTS